MKRLIALLVFALPSIAATRPAVLTWTSTATGVTGFTISSSPTPTGTFAVLATLPATALTYTDNPTIGTSVTYKVLALSTACTPTTPVTATCGSVPAATVTTTVPNQPGGSVSIILTIP